jgi:hypothetical protein
MRVQRTRSSPSAPHSPLTRRPLGGQSRCFGLVALAVLAVSATFCASTASAPKVSNFGVIDQNAPALAADQLSEVNRDMTLEHIFRRLGPAHASSKVWSPTGDLCWEWHFENGVILIIPKDSDPRATPRRFDVMIRDYSEVTRS